MFPIEPTTLRPRPWPAYLIMFIAIGMIFIPQNNTEHTVVYIALGLFIFSLALWFLLSKAGITIDDPRPYV